ncbi:MAG: hypothetical protein RJA70_3718, partial [Pseudomonadota bacterium]
MLYKKRAMWLSKGQYLARPSAACLVALALSVFTATGCTDEVTGPTPGFSEAPDELALDPGVICADQLTTDITLNGEDFSPVVIDIPDDPKAALPSVRLTRTTELDGADAEAAVTWFSGNPDDKTNLQRLSWQSQTRMTLRIDQALTLPGDVDGPLPIGMHDAELINPNTNQTESLGALAVVSKPTLAAPSPGITCVAQGDREIELTGTTLLEINGALPTLEVAGVAKAFGIDELEGCTDIAHEGVDAKYCTTGRLSLAQDSLKPGYPEVVLRNPQTAACGSEEVINLRVVPPPAIDSVGPPLACVTEEEREFTIAGKDFLVIDGDLPSLTLDGKSFKIDSAGDCKNLPTMGHKVETCKELSFSIMADAVPPGTPEVVVTNPEPAGCEASNAVALTIVPPPSVEVVQPELVCVAEEERAVTISGKDFLVVAGEVPTVTIGDVVVPAASVAATNCTALEVDGLEVERCETLEVLLAQSSVEPQLADVSVENPQPAGCSSTLAQALAIVDPPQIISTSDALVCTDDGARPITITGTGFIRVGGVLPAVLLDGAEIPVDAIGDCSSVGLASGATDTCTTLSVTLPQGSLSEGQALLEVVNPEPAGCTGSNSMVLTGPPPLALVSAMPGNLCQSAGTTDVVVAGTGFLNIEGVPFTVSVNGAAVVPSAVGGCQDLTVDGLDIESCTSFTISADPTLLPDGGIEITVTNPAPSDCTETSTRVFQIVPPPTVVDVAPDNVCSDVSTTINVTGTNFAPGAIVLAGAVQATAVNVTSPTQLTATFMAGLPAGTHDITVNNDAAGLCSGTAPAALVVDPTPFAFFVDPPVLYNGIEIETTIFTSGLKANASKVELVDANNVATEITDISSPLRPNRIQ